MFFYYLYRVKGAEGNKTMLFIHQTKFQKHLLKRYGTEMVLMDSTYKVTRYDNHLSLVVVPTNVGYFVTAALMMKRETMEGYKEALKILKSWNPEWSPNAFITDYDRREINAVEIVFMGK
jgi:hypothetical protein